MQVQRTNCRIDVLINNASNMDIVEHTPAHRLCTATRLCAH